ncbi:hypothetical protein Sphch_2972 [Sphingobium chlorophenolicum L-1]|uniref:DUF4142 domain-containing protein n=1 Tax=Sphingobium chlorophenolicum L-1 TaxID=690566 RepID=F6F2E0_SPHCR|nr:DUF4142 domain-containing protein [Sphingobium chlorophenolicum]AEG50602.1 hypothetical protein Sphch_2972 [Sphingobium chlorophenolicum L-1]
MARIGLLTGCALLLLPACQGGGNSAAANDGAAMNAAGQNAAGTNDMAAATPALQATSASDYLAKAGAGDLFEIQSSQAVLEKTKNAKVRDFATMMVKAHQQSTAKLKAAAGEAKLTVKPPVLTSDQQAMLDAIKSAPADGVDMVYAAHQRTAHEAALQLHRSYAADGDMAPLRRAAGEIVPVVESHIQHLADLPQQ